MNYFSIITEGQIVVRKNGSYFQRDIYVRGGLIYAKHGGGYVKLLKGGATTVPTIKWDELDCGQGDCIEEGIFVRYVAPEELADMMDGAA